MVYRVKSGFVRQRPLTAPNLSRYAQKDDHMEKEYGRKKSIHQKMDSLLKLAMYQQGSQEHVAVDTSDRPIPVEYKRAQTPKVVSDTDLEETEQKVKELCFNMETEKGRRYIMTETAIDFYIPKYKEKWLEKQNQEMLPWPIKKKKKSAPLASSVSKDEVIHSLAYPEPRIPPSHAKRCDARFRGWHVVRSQKGPHYILTSPCFTNTTKGQVERSAHARSMNQIRKVRSDLLFRYTSKDKVDSRPITAPAVMEEKDYGQHKIPPKSSASSSSGYWSQEGKPTQSLSSKSATERALVPESDNQGAEGERPVAIAEENQYEVGKQLKTKEDSESKVKQETAAPKVQPNSGGENIDLQDKMDIESTSSQENAVSPLGKLPASDRVINTDMPDPIPDASRDASLTEYKRKERSPTGSKKTETHKHYSSSGGYKKSSGVSVTEDIAPMPHMEHKKPRLVLVGNMGQIRLLENIREAPFWEELSVIQKEESESSAYESSDTESSSSMKVDSSQKVKKKKKKRKKRITSSEEKILSMIIAAEKAQMNKERKHPVLNSSKASTKSSSSSGSAPSQDAAVLVEALVADVNARTKSSTPSDKHEGTSYPKSSSQIGSESIMFPENKLPSPIPVVTSRSPSSHNTSIGHQTTVAPGKHVVIVGHNSDATESPRAKRSTNKYERLVKRMDGGISDRLSKRLLSKGAPACTKS